MWPGCTASSVLPELSLALPAPSQRSQSALSHFQCRLACRHPNVALALRYNQRGVGFSTGWSSFWGGADCRDLKQLCTELAAQSSPAVQLAVIGYGLPLNSCIFYAPARRDCTTVQHLMSAILQWCPFTLLRLCCQVFVGGMPGRFRHPTSQRARLSRHQPTCR